MDQIKNNVWRLVILIWVSSLILFITLSGFGSMPRSGELTLELDNPKDDSKVTYTKWRFISYNFPKGKLNKLKFSAAVKTEFYEFSDDRVKNRIKNAVEKTSGQKMVLEVFDAEKLDKDQYVAKAQIRIESRVLEGRFLFRPSIEGHYNFEGKFEMDGNWFNSELIRTDINFALKAFIPHKN